jgi:alpha-L-arabinofuranosidase
MDPAYYANEFRKYSTFMADWTNSGKLYRIASGANSSDFNWTEVCMKNIPKSTIEGLALHHYAVIDWGAKGPSTTFNEQQYFSTMKSALYMDELITKHSAIMDKYDPEKKVALIVDEWGGWYDVEPGTNPGFLYQQNTMRDAMIAGTTLNIFHKHSERVRMANLAQTINVLQAVILTEEDKMILTPTYHVLEMYKVHQDATNLPIQVNSTDYSVGNEKLPAVSVSASKNNNGLTHISLVNIDAHNAQEISIDLEGAKYSTVKGRILASKKLQDYNSFDNTDRIKPVEYKDAKLKSNKLTLKIPAFSVIVLELK